MITVRLSVREREKTTQTFLFSAYMVYSGTMKGYLSTFLLFVLCLQSRPCLSKKDLFLITVSVDCTALGGGKTPFWGRTYEGDLMTRVNAIYQNASGRALSANIAYDFVRVTMPCQSTIIAPLQQNATISCDWLPYSFANSSCGDCMSVCLDSFALNFAQARYSNYYNYVVLGPYQVIGTYSSVQNSHVGAQLGLYPWTGGHLGIWGNVMSEAYAFAHEYGHGRYGLDHCTNGSADFDSLARSYPSGINSYYASPGYGDMQDFMGIGNDDAGFGAVHLDFTGLATQSPAFTSYYGIHGMGNITDKSNYMVAGFPWQGWEMELADYDRVPQVVYYKFTALDPINQYFISYRPSSVALNLQEDARFRDVLMLHKGRIPLLAAGLNFRENMEPLFLKVFRSVGDVYINPGGDFTMTYTGMGINGPLFDTNAAQY
jgi:hypothetical protein